MSLQSPPREELGGDWQQRLGSSVRWLLVAAGLLGLVVAVLIAVVPEAARLLPIAAIVAVLGSDYVVVAAVGLFAVGCAGVLFGIRIQRGVTAATPPVVEGVQSATYPGVAVDRTGGRSLLTASSPDAGERRQRLRTAAIQATQIAEGCSADAARDRVDDGSWTADQVASAFLAAEGASDTDSAGGSRREVASDRTVKRTLAAITHVADAESGDGSDWNARRLQ